MLLKRKRSDDELSPFSPGGMGYGYSSPLQSDNGDIAMMDTDTPLSPKTILSPTLHTRSRSCTPSHLPSRTFKRLRNGRPSEDEVHQNTLKMLYQAQHHQPQHPQHHFSPPAQAASMQPPPPQPSAAPVHNQPSLHSFWKIPAAPKSSSPFSMSPAAPSPSIDAVIDRPTSCEDCGVGLGGEDATMDDGYGFEAYINTCSSCSKAVCFSCSISNLGEQRRCLACAGGETPHIGKKWVGGAGWTSESMTVY